MSKVAILVCFQSLILDMAGNVGTQSLAVTIRVLMDEDITFKTRLALIWKEVKIGMASQVCWESYPSSASAFTYGCLREIPSCTAFASACVVISLLLGDGHLQPGRNCDSSVFPQNQRKIWQLPLVP